MKENKVSMLIAGDLLPTKTNEFEFMNAEVEKLFGKELQVLFKNSDLCVANLEGPLTDCDKAIKKSGPNLRASEKTITGIKKLGIDCLSIANNHIMDYGEEGIQSTWKVLSDNDIDWVGGGKNLEEANVPKIYEIEGLKIGIYSCAEYEFTIATKNQHGANPYDEVEIWDDIVKLKAKVDYLIILYHGGKEYYRYPVPYVQKRCRKMIEKGADIVLCQHSHCIGCAEKYMHGQILYGQGNFLFDRGDDDFRNTGLLVKITLPERNVEYIPIVKTGNGVRLGNSEQAQKVKEEFERRSMQIKEEDFVKRNYANFAKEKLEVYEAWLLGSIGCVMYKLHLSKIFRWNYRRKDKLRILNCFRCEAHRDLCINGLIEYSEKSL